MDSLVLVGRPTPEPVNFGAPRCATHGDILVLGVCDRCADKQAFRVAVAEAALAEEELAFDEWISRGPRS